MITYQRFLFKSINPILNLNKKYMNTLVSYNFSSDQKNPKYQFPFNFNRQEHRDYIKKVEKAKQQIQEVQQLQKGQVLPRRKRRLYDRPKHDTQLATYAVWRLYDPEETQIKLFEHSMQVVAKLNLQPKWVIHALGKGLIPVNNRLGSHREFVFEDNNLSKFVLYEYRNTTQYRKNIPDYDYENQQHIRPEMRKIKRLQPQDFWESEEHFEFRINCTSYAEHLKFCRWVTETIEKRKTQESYDQVIDKKFSKAVCFNEKADMQLFQPRTPFIMHVSPQTFEIQKEEKAVGKGKKEKKVETALAEEVKPKSAYNFAYQLDESLRKQYKPEQKRAKSTDL